MLSLESKIRYISLAEAISIALEQGTVGNQTYANTVSGSDTYLDSEVTFSGRGSFTDAIRVFAIDPAATGANIDLSLSKFDAVFNTSLSWNVTDQPVATSAQTFQAGGQDHRQPEAADFQRLSSSRCRLAVRPASPSTFPIRTRTLPPPSTRPTRLL